MWFSRPKRIYLDFASATPVRSEARKAVEKLWDTFGNPGGIHADGVAAEKVLEAAREKIALELACKAREVIFTSGGTEGNNIAILGVARKILKRQDDFSSTHWVVSSIEHPSVLECFGEIERLGGSVTHVDPDERGTITKDAVLTAVKKNTVLVSIGWANSETGTVQPIREIALALKEMHPDILIHTDAGQAPLYLAPHVHTLDVDLMTLDSGKMYGPRGVGALYLSNRVDASSVTLGGGQERGLRPGTENVALAAGFAEAFALAGSERKAESLRLQILRDTFLKKLIMRIPEIVVNGDIKRALPNMLNVSLPNIQSEYVTLQLDAKGISISTKSACREGENRRSHVVEALGGPEWRAENTLRFSLGRTTTAKELDTAIDELAACISKSET
jgi:cysteine desulfurase